MYVEEVGVLYVEGLGALYVEELGALYVGRGRCVLRTCSPPGGRCFVRGVRGTLLVRRVR